MFRKFGDEIAVVLERFRAGVGGCELPRSLTDIDAGVRLNPRRLFTSQRVKVDIEGHNRIGRRAARLR